MSSAQRKGAAQEKPALRDRLRAWWKGVDCDMAASRPAEARSRVPRVQPMPGDLAAPLAPWESPAMRVAQLAWGEGCSKPGGTGYLVDLAKPLGLDATKSVMEFGVGLGGGARAIRQAFGAWVSGYEIDAEMARAARRLSVLARVEKEVDIACYSPQDFSPRNGSYDVILSTETLYQVERKEDLLIKLERGLRARGQIVITDYVLGPGISADDERLKAVAPGSAHFWTASLYARHFRERNLDLRESADITAKYRKLVIDGCKRFTEGGPQVIANAKAYPEATIAFLDFWASRVTAFEAGLLKVVRFSVAKSSGLKLMSDW
jgi:cyclopropane fatty-acyl-phospholipid synthase-like methyltransferase